MARPAIIDDSATRRILDAGEIATLPPEIELHDAAIWLDDIALRFIRRRRTDMFDKRKRLRTMMGTRLRKLLYENLICVWDILTGRYPPVARWGAFPQFVGAFCGELSSYLERHYLDRDPAAWQKIIRNLEKIRDDASGEQVRDGLRLVEREIFPHINQVLVRLQKKKIKRRRRRASKFPP